MILVFVIMNGIRVIWLIMEKRCEKNKLYLLYAFFSIQINLSKAM